MAFIWSIVALRNICKRKFKQTAVLHLFGNSVIIVNNEFCIRVEKQLLVGEVQQEVNICGYLR